MIANEGLDWGSDVVFTYGPLGFLAVPQLVFGGTGSLAIAFTVASQFALILSIAVAARRALTLPLALALAYALASVINQEERGEIITPIVFIWAVMAIEGRLGDRLARALPFAGGAVCAAALLIKLNVGVACLVLAVLAVGWLPPGRLASLIRFAMSFVATFLVGWFATGNAPSSIPEWLRQSRQIVSGYSSAMVLEPPGVEWEYWAFGVLAAVLAVLLAARARLHPSLLDATRTVCLAAAAGWFAWIFFKHGFVRHDSHSVLSFTMLAIVPLAFRWPGTALRIAAGAAAVGALALSYRAAHSDPLVVLDPVPRVQLAAEHLSDVIADRDRLISDARTEAIRQAAVDPSLLAAIGRRSVAIDPHETSVAWAHRFTWRPLPTFQAYQAYTPALDNANAEFLGSSRAPERILRQRLDGRFDGRSGDHEPPATTIALVCNYRQEAVVGGWQLLAKIPNRCGPPRFIQSARLAEMELVPVPAAAAPDELIFAKARFPSRSLGFRVRALAFRPPKIPVIYLSSQPYRLIEGWLTQPLIVRTSTTSGFAPEFAGAPDQSSVGFSAVPAPLDVDFYGMKVAAPAG